MAKYEDAGSVAGQIPYGSLAYPGVRCVWRIIIFRRPDYDTIVREAGTMNLTQMKYFITVAKCRSFTKAAEILFVTQPALSRQINAMEEELNMQHYNPMKDVFIEHFFAD